MSNWPAFNKFDSAQADLLGDDFDSKYSLKVKSAGPYGTTLTSTTTFKESKDGKGCCNCTLVPKLAVKYAHSSGFTVEKFEVTDTAKATIETSLVGVAPGLKMEFKGNDSDKADLSFKYVAPVATVTGEVDAYGFKSAKASVCSGHGDITVGANANIKVDKMAVQSTTFGLGMGYKMPNIFVGLRADNNLSKYSARWSYDGFKGVNVAGDVVHDKDVNASVVGAWNCNPDTNLKLKVATNDGGILYASCKQSFPNKFSVIGSAEVPVSMNNIKFGLNATLG